MTFLYCLLAFIVLLSFILLIKTHGKQSVIRFITYLITLNVTLGVVLFSNSLWLTIFAGMLLTSFLIITFVFDC